MLVFINDSLIAEHEAKISIFDRGFLYGDGVFETLRAYNGVIFRCNDHMDRLFHSAETIHIKIPFTKDWFKEALYNVLKENSLREAYLRLSVTRGVSKPALDTEGCTTPGVVILPTAFSGYPDELYGSGIHAAVVETRRTPPSALDPGIKSLNFLNNIMARIEAKGFKATEGIMLSIDGYVTEGTVSNIFIAKNGVVKTAPLSVGILNGVTRSIVIELAEEHNIPFIEQLFCTDELYDADECFITNTIYEVMPVTSINNRAVGNGQCGKLTEKILRLYKDLVKGEIC